MLETKIEGTMAKGGRHKFKVFPSNYTRQTKEKQDSEATELRRDVGGGQGGSYNGGNLCLLLTVIRCGKGRQT